MKRFIAFCLALLIVCTLVGCSNPANDNMDNSENSSSNELAQFTRIDAILYYDNATRIVYMFTLYNGTPYYAPNGLPYRYNPETNTLEQIEWGIYGETMTED